MTVLSAGNQAQAAVTDNMFPNYGWNCWSGGPVYDGNETFCRTDNNYFTWGWEASITDSGGLMAAANDFNGTDLTTAGEVPVYTGGSETDVVWQAGPLPPNLGGVAWCDDAVSSTKCDQHYARFWTGAPNHYLSCHETGHTVGLTHGPDANPRLDINDARLACMNYVQNDPWLGYNNYDNINGAY
ncbi:hypothetical protein [Embleya sp. NBC_00896]|uniref:hypothetical protein n=1 Tax=Embleya sp. NBC_00896 TaxID=2975961 RepID=UPI002F906F03|nr:hypothetical protein OG928_44525 [Embleya sp. NBC_00896]